MDTKVAIPCQEGKRTFKDWYDSGRTHCVLKVLDIVKYNEGAFSAQFKGAALQVGLGTRHLIMVVEMAVITKNNI